MTATEASVVVMTRVHGNVQPGKPRVWFAETNHLFSYDGGIYILFPAHYRAAAM